VAIAAWAVPLGLAQHNEGEEHGAPAEFKMPTTYKAAVQEIEHRLHEIDELIKAKDLEHVHAQADIIKQVGSVIGQLALKPDSGVPREAVKDVNIAGKALAAKFDDIDKAGDSGDQAGTRRVYEEMVTLTATLLKYVPKAFACPMKCEGDKTYPAAGKCPKCGMDLVEVKPAMEQQGKHGGVLVMSPDKKHHVEATLAAGGELRLYFYNDKVEPASAEKVTAAGKAWMRSATEADGKPLALALEPGKGFLTGKLDPSLKPPLSVKVTVDFKDGQKPQVVSFDLGGPTEAPADKPHDDHMMPAPAHDGGGHGH
jgi:hypothetical protein